MFYAESAFSRLKKDSLLTINMLVGAGSIRIVIELGFTPLQNSLVIWNAVNSPNHTVFSS